MRSMVPYPAGKQMFPQLLRAAGYYCTNNSKEDYNLAKPGQVWDVSSGKAHWRRPGRRAAFFRRLQLDQKPRKPDPHPSAQARTRSGRRARAGVSSRHARGAPRLGPILRRCERRRRRRGRASARARTRRPGRHDDRFLLRRPWLGHATIEAIAVQLRLAGAAGRVHTRGVQQSAARRVPGWWRDRPVGELCRFRAHGAQPGRYRAARVDAGVCVPWPACRAAAATGVRLSRPHGRAL